MFDIGFAELVIIAVVGLLVIGPERLPGAVRTGSAWLSRLRRGFNDLKMEVQQELHNDAVLQDLKKTGEDIRQQADELGKDLASARDAVSHELLQEPPEGDNPPQSQDSPSGPDKP
jgi:sec-independent protein translocase protein TatB